jgi:hypothetical protein
MSLLLIEGGNAGKPSFEGMALAAVKVVDDHAKIHSKDTDQFRTWG